MNYLWAFVIGGLFCVVGQLLIDYTKLTPARILTAYVVAGVILGAFGVYKPLTKFGGAGATVPLTGFGYLLYDGVKNAVDDKGFVGIFTGGISSAAGGITAALVFGFLAACVFKSKQN
ncbi:MAG: stage V sporulation protein AE [Ruminococcus sp.]|nr:stage V sporulation protein AE [Ruminococcus sp.]